MRDHRRDIVFDLGGVVVTWDPYALINRLSADPAVRSTVADGVLNHPDWVELDRGRLSREEAVERAVERTGLTREVVSGFLGQVPHALQPVPEMVDLLYRLKENGNRLFCLSNMHVEAMGHLERSYSFWEVFAGMVISCRVHLCKPEPAIYEHLLAEHGLDPSNATFIDDMKVNLVPAAHLGIDTILFRDPLQCERQLSSLGCI